MKHEDPIEEIWRIREELSAEEGYDVHRLFERLRREEKKYESRLVRAAPHHAPKGEAPSRKKSLTYGIPR